MFLSNKKNTTSKEDILVFNHSLTTMDNGDFVSKLSNIIDFLKNSSIVSKKGKSLFSPFIELI